MKNWNEQLAEYKRVAEQAAGCEVEDVTGLYVYMGYLTFRTRDGRRLRVFHDNQVQWL